MKPWVKIALAGALTAVLVDHFATPTIRKSVGLK